MANLRTREARRSLKRRHAPHWSKVRKGLGLGYRRAKGARAGSWIGRKPTGQEKPRFTFKTFGLADDDPKLEADGENVLNYEQALDKVLAWANLESKAPGTYTVRQATDAYLEYCRAETKSAADAEMRINAHIIPTFGNRRVAELRADEIRRWHRKIATSAPVIRGKEQPFDKDDPEAVRKRKATANRTLTILKAALNQAARDGYATHPERWRDVTPFREVEIPRTRFLTEKECQRLINAADAEFCPLIRGALQTGCRYGELIAMRCEDYDAESRTVAVARTKGGKARHVYLTDEGAALFDLHTAGKVKNRLVFQRADGEPWQKGHQSRRMRVACERAKLEPPASFHDLRRSYGALLARAGVPLQVIAIAMGHADTRMTEKHYAHLQPDHVAQTVRVHLPAFGAEDSNVASLDR